MIERTYNPKGYSCSITVNVTEEQAKVLDKIAEREEFSAYFWAEKVDWFNKRNKDVIRINGEHMTIGPEDSCMKGFGGRKQYIILDNGKEIESTNIWHQGKIPEELKDILKDNAKWKY